MLGIFHSLGKLGRRFRLNLDESPVSDPILNVVWVMTFGANKPALFARAGPFADPLAVNAIPPVAQFVAVAFSCLLYTSDAADE